MLFNLGRTNFLGFKKLVLAVSKHDWLKAAEEMEDSGWFRSKPNNRQKRLAVRMRIVHAQSI